MVLNFYHNLKIKWVRKPVRLIVRFEIIQIVNKMIKNSLYLYIRSMLIINEYLPF